MFEKILVPVDLTDLEVSKPALERAIAVAKSFNAALRLVNVQTLVPAAYVEYVPVEFDSEERKRALQGLQELTKTIGYPADRISFAVRVGSVYHEVLTEAEQWHADLVIVGSHRPTLATYLIGSNAGNIVRHARCSVLVVR